MHAAGEAAEARLRAHADPWRYARRATQYRLKFGPLGVLMDAALVRPRWRAGIDSFMRGLKQLAERGPDTVGP